MPAPHAPRCWCATTSTPWSWRSSTTAAGRTSARARVATAGMGWSGCASGSHCTAARCTPARAPPRRGPATPCGSGCPRRRQGRDRHDPDPGGRRRGGGRAGPPAPPRRGAHGRAHATAGRDPGDPAPGRPGDAGQTAETTIRVLILTTFDHDEYVYEAMRAGASGFLLKTVRPRQLAAAVHDVAAGDALLAPDITRRLIEQFVHRPPPGSAVPPALGELTPREVEVLRLVARGLSNAEIAGALVVGETTVHTHVARILAKLGARDRVQAVVAAYESGLVQPGAG